MTTSDRDVRSRVLLGRGVRVPAGAGGDVRRGRICGRDHAEPDVPGRLLAHDRPRRGPRGSSSMTSQVTFDQLLEVFWAMHDPTQVNRQGPDVGDQYRSVIFTTTGRTAGGRGGVEGRARRRGSTGRSRREIDRRRTFYPAEDYHQAVLREERAHAVLPRGPGQGPRGAGVCCPRAAERARVRVIGCRPMTRHSALQPDINGLRREPRELVRRGDRARAARCLMFVRTTLNRRGSRPPCACRRRTACCSNGHSGRA